MPQDHKHHFRWASHHPNSQIANQPISSRQHAPHKSTIRTVPLIGRNLRTLSGTLNDTRAISQSQSGKLRSHRTILACKTHRICIAAVAQPVWTPMSAPPPLLPLRNPSTLKLMCFLVETQGSSDADRPCGQQTALARLPPPTAVSV